AAQLASARSQVSPELTLEPKSNLLGQQLLIIDVMNQHARFATCQSGVTMMVQRLQVVVTNQCASLLQSQAELDVFVPVKVALVKTTYPEEPLVATQQHSSCDARHGGWREYADVCIGFRSYFRRPVAVIHQSETDAQMLNFRALRALTQAPV